MSSFAFCFPLMSGGHQVAEIEGQCEVSEMGTGTPYLDIRLANLLWRKGHPNEYVACDPVLEPMIAGYLWIDHYDDIQRCADENARGGWERERLANRAGA